MLKLERVVAAITQQPKGAVWQARDNGANPDRHERSNSYRRLRCAPFHWLEDGVAALTLGVFAGFVVALAALDVVFLAIGWVVVDGWTDGKGVRRLQHLLQHLLLR